MNINMNIFCIIMINIYLLKYVSIFIYIVFKYDIFADIFITGNRIQNVIGHK